MEGRFLAQGEIRESFKEEINLLNLEEPVRIRQEEDIRQNKQQVQNQERCKKQ